MSPASYLTAPPRVAGVKSTILRVPIYVWPALAIALVALFGAPVVAAMRAWRTLKTFKAVARHASEVVEEVARSAAQTEERALAATQGAERLANAVTHLQGSLAELQVLKTAADETRTGLGRITGLRPRK
jgi:hypothetical protein